MTIFRYEAIGTDGRTVKGDLDAPDERAAAAHLRGRALFITRLANGSAAGTPAAASRGVPRSQALVFLFREIKVARRNINGIGAFGSSVIGGIASR